jgi:hypothetical protein
MSTLNYALTLYAIWKVAYIVEYTYNTIYYTKKIKDLLSSTKHEIIRDNIDTDWVYIEKDENTLLIDKSS